MEEVQIDAMELDFVLQEGIEPCLLGTPLEATAPVLDEITQVSHISAVRPGFAWGLIRKAGA
jgi:hypothetical protein